MIVNKGLGDDGIGLDSERLSNQVLQVKVGARRVARGGMDEYVIFRPVAVNKKPKIT